jgi:hypothetical protein
MIELRREPGKPGKKSAYNNNKKKKGGKEIQPTRRRRRAERRAARKQKCVRLRKQRIGIVVVNVGFIDVFHETTKRKKKKESKVEVSSHR